MSKQSKLLKPKVEFQPQFDLSLVWSKNYNGTYEQAAGDKKSLFYIFHFIPHLHMLLFLNDILFFYDPFYLLNIVEFATNIYHIL
jgi:hypothetical protein